MFVFSPAKLLCAVNYMRLRWLLPLPVRLRELPGAVQRWEDARCSWFSGSVRPVNENGCCLCWNLACCLVEMEALLLPSHSAIALREGYRTWAQAHTRSSITGDDRWLIVCMQCFGTSIPSCWLADAEILRGGYAQCTERGYFVV